MQEEPAIGLYHDTRHPSKKFGFKFPVKVRITWQVHINGKSDWDPRYLRTGQYVTPEDFRVLEIGKAKSSDLRKSQELVFKVRANAKSIIESNKRIGIDQFFYEYDKRFGGGGEKVRNPQLVSIMFDQLIAEKNSTEDIGTANSYTNAKVSLIKFGGPYLLITDITGAWLRAYESWMVDEQGNSLNTVGFYLRPLRSLCLQALKNKTMTPEQYPFGKDRYVIRKKRTKKKGLPEFVKTNILRYVPICNGEAEAVDFSMFSFLAHGMNMTDIAYLRDSQILSDHFVFIRRKTRKTVLAQKEIKIPLSQQLRDVIARRGIHKGYVFGVITEDMDAKTKKMKIKNWIRLTNKWLKRIAVNIGYTDRISTYSWRHTFVSMLLNANIPLTKVKDALGHQTITTTQDYAEDLDLKTAKGFTDILIKP